MILKNERSGTKFSTGPAPCFASHGHQAWANFDDPAMVKAEPALATALPEARLSSRPFQSSPHSSVLWEENLASQKKIIRGR
jgi:hypothetical protein